MNRTLKVLSIITLALILMVIILYVLPLGQGRPLLTSHLIRSLHHTRDTSTPDETIQANVPLASPSQTGSASPNQGDSESEGRARLAEWAPTGFLLEPAAYSVTCHATLENHGQEPLHDLVVQVPIFSSHGRWQQVRDLRVSPRPDAINRNRGDFQEALFQRKILAPGEKLEIKVSARVMVHHLVNPLYSQSLECSASRDTGSPGAQPWLGAEPYVESNAAPIVELAERLSRGQAGNPCLELLSFYDHICRKLGFNASLEPLGALGSIKRGSIQCADAVHLMMALGRSRGLPSRYIGGLYLGNQHDLNHPQLVDDTHAWGWFWISGNGWIVVDPTLGRFDENSRYACFAEQRHTYLTLWADHREPFRFSARGNEAKIQLAAAFWTEVVGTPAWEKAPHTWRDAYGMQPAQAGIGLSWMGPGSNQVPVVVSTALEAGRYGAAWQVVKAALAKDRPSPGVRLAQARVYLAIKHLSGAWQTLSHYVKLRPDDPQGYRGILVLLHRLDAIDELNQWANQAVKRFPGDGGFLAERGYARLNTGNPAGAEDDLRLALKLEPANGRYHALQGRILAAEGRNREAAAALRRGLELGLPPGEINYYRRMLELMQAGPGSL